MERHRTIILHTMLEGRLNSGTGRAAREARKLLIWLALMPAWLAHGQTCATGDEMDAPTRGALEAAAQRYFGLAAKGDVAGLKQGAIPSVAENFSGIATAVQESQANLAAAKAAVRGVFALTVDEPTPGQASTQPAEQRLEFLCGVFGKSGQTTSSAVFVLNGLPPGRYAVAILDVAAADGTSKESSTQDGSNRGGAYVVSFVLQQVAAEWKLGGFYAKAGESAGHDSAWFAERARAFVAKGQMHNAWFYFLQARNLATVVPFMSTRETDRLYDEAQKIKTADLPGEAPMELLAGGKSYKIRAIFVYGVAGTVNLVVKYDWADVSDAAKTYAENQAVARALVAKWPELRDGFGAIVTRATEASGKDYGTLVGMGELK